MYLMCDKGTTVSAGRRICGTPLYHRLSFGLREKKGKNQAKLCFCGGSGIKIVKLGLKGFYLGRQTMAPCGGT